MEQLILHLIGDYITQTDAMAVRKTKSMPWAMAHACAYGLPFLLLGGWWAACVIILTHCIIDRYRLSKYAVFAKNKVTSPGLEWRDCSATGYPSAAPAWMSVWLMIVADNTIHLMINYAALRWL